MWRSKKGSYETPYYVIGIVKFTGLDQNPKDRCKDRNNGTRKGTRFAKANRLTKKQ